MSLIIYLDLSKTMDADFAGRCMMEDRLSVFCIAFHSCLRTHFYLANLNNFFSMLQISVVVPHGNYLYIKKSCSSTWPPDT